MESNDVTNKTPKTDASGKKAKKGWFSFFSRKSEDEKLTDSNQQSSDKGRKTIGLSGSDAVKKTDSGSGSPTKSVRTGWRDKTSDKQSQSAGGSADRRQVNGRFSTRDNLKSEGGKATDANSKRLEQAKKRFMTAGSSKNNTGTTSVVNAKNAKSEVPADGGKKKKGFLSRLSFLKFNNIRIVNLVYIGFSILIVTLIAVSVSSFIKFSTLKSAFQDVTEKTTPIVLKADRLEANLISTHKSLVDILTATNTEDIKRLTTIYENEIIKLVDSRSEFLASVGDAMVLQEDTDKLVLLLKSYLDTTELIPRKFLGWSEDNAVSLVQMSKYRASVGNFSTAYASVQRIIEQEDDYVFQETKTAEIPKGVLITMVDEALSSSDPNKIKKIMDSMKPSLEQFSNLIKTIERDWPDFKNELGSYYTPFLADISGEKGVLNEHYKLALRQDELKKITKEANDKLSDLRDCIAKVGFISNNEMIKSVSNAYNLINRSYLELSVILVIGIILAICVATVVARVIRIPLQRIVTTINAMCDYDMTHKVKYNSSSEFGFLAKKINQLIDVFSDMLGQIAKSSETLKASAHDNSESMFKTSQKIKEQLDQTAMIDSAMDALKQAADNVASSAETSLSEIIASNEAAETGRRLMSDNITTNHQLSSKLDKTTAAITNVRTMSDNINQIVGVIKDIANQTNLLALNAAIESAHAGEHGKGFAVVADHVRNLAQRTGDATREVEGLIQSLHSVVDEAVSTIKECGDEMERSVLQTSEVNSSIEELKAILISISDMAHQIASAAEEQRATTVDINSNVEMISALSGENSIEIEKAKESSLALDKLATEQKQLVSKFKF